MTLGMAKHYARCHSAVSLFFSDWTWFVTRRSPSVDYSHCLSNVVCGKVDAPEILACRIWCGWRHNRPLSDYTLKLIVEFCYLLLTFFSSEQPGKMNEHRIYKRIDTWVCSCRTYDSVATHRIIRGHRCGPLHRLTITGMNPESKG